MDMDYAFLRNYCQEHLRSHKLLFILRGAPGCGKTTLAEAILSIYPDSIHICADNFPGYYNQQGTYVWSKELRTEAHRWTFQLATSAFEQKGRCVVIDKTNTKTGDFECYLELARQYGYTVIVVTPKCHGRVSPQQLAQRSKHGVPAERIEREYYQAFEIAVPRYFAWFLNLSDSQQLLDFSKRVLMECYECLQPFKNMIGCHDGDEPSVAVDKYFNRSYSPTIQLHCTARHCGNHKSEDNLNYLNSRLVKESIGNVFVLHISSIIVSPKTVGARVCLSENMLPLWDSGDKVCYVDEENNSNGGTGDGDGSGSAGEDRNQCGNYNNIDDIHIHGVDHDIDDNSGCRTNEFVIVTKSLCKLTDADGDLVNLKMRNDCNFKDDVNYACGDVKISTAETVPGERAHITLYLADGVAPVETGCEQLHAIQLERSCLPLEEAKLGCGKVKHYRGDYFIVDLLDPLSIVSLFTGYY